MKRLIHRNRPNRPHISSDILFSNNVGTKAPETKTNRCANYLSAPACQYPKFCDVSPPCFPNRSAFPPSRPVCLSSASAPPVKGVLVPTPNTRNPKIHKNFKNHQKDQKINNINTLHTNNNTNTQTTKPKTNHKTPSRKNTNTTSRPTNNNRH